MAVSWGRRSISALSGRTCARFRAATTSEFQAETAEWPQYRPTCPGAGRRSRWAPIRTGGCQRDVGAGDRTRLGNEARRVAGIAAGEGGWSAKSTAGRTTCKLAVVVGRANEAAAPSARPTRPLMAIVVSSYGKAPLG